jgi:hypothetical protein
VSQARISHPESHPKSRPKRRWILALPLIAASVALSGGASAREASAREAGGDTAEVPAHRSVAQKPAKVEEQRHPRHHFAHHAKSRAPDPDEKAPPAPFRPTAFHREDVPLEPRPVSTMRVQAPPEELPAPHATTPAAAADAPAAEVSVGQRVEPDTARVDLPTTAETVEAAATSAADDASAAGPSVAIKVLALFGACTAAALGCCGLLMLNTRRRNARRMGLAPSRRNPAGRPPPPRDDRFTERVAQQRLFPHQFGTAIRG